MPLITGYINVYRSGWFHREGKPYTFDRHAGDVYPTREAAIEAIDPPSHYVATTPVTWWEEAAIEPNPGDSLPLPLIMSRRPYLRAAKTREVEHALA